MHAFNSTISRWLKVNIESFTYFSYATFKADTCMQCIYAKIGLTLIPCRVVEYLISSSVQYFK